MKLARFGFLCGIICSAALARPLQSPPNCSANPTECVIDLFIQISRIYRPSLGEGALREAIMDLAQRTASQGWKLPNGFPVQVDPTGNLVIRLPATGRFTSQTESVALQSHMDMVTVVARQSPGVDLSYYFQDGVDVVRENGVLHSSGYATTLGADNGIGVAMMLRYLVDPSLEHPPLELVFTVCEEKNGMVGARGLALDLRSTVLINLDEEKDGSVCHGCMGGNRVKVAGPLATDNDSDFVILDVHVAGLRQGHSGSTLHEARANAVQFAARLLKFALDNDPTCRLLSLEAGDIDTLNVIPGEFSLKMAVQPQSAARVTYLLEKEYPRLLALYTDENKRPEFQIQTIMKRVDGLAFKRRVSEQVAGSLSGAPNNVIESADASTYPHGLLSGSSLGFARFANGEGQVAFMARAYRPDALEKASNLVIESLLGAWPNPPRATVTYLAKTPAWEADPQSWLMQLITRSVPQFPSPGRAMGGLEVGVIAAMYPQILGVAVGPLIEAAHEPQESVKVSSIASVVEGVDNVLRQIGLFRQSGLSCAQFLERFGGGSQSSTL